MEQNYQFRSPVRGRGAREIQTNVWPSPAAEDFQGIGSPSSPMQNNSISRTFPNQTSYLGFASSSQPNFSLPHQSDILQEFHSPNGSSPYLFPDNISHSQQRLNQEPPWNPLQVSPPKPPGELLDGTNHPLPKRRKLNAPDPGPLQYPHGPTSDSGYRTLSDYSPSGYHISEPGTKQQDPSIQDYMQPFNASVDDKYCCSSTGDPQNDLGNDLLQPVPPPTCGSSVDNELRTLACEWEDCEWTGKCESEYKKHHKQHTRPFKCDVNGCDNQKGFPTLNDLERHKHSKHGIQTEGNRPKYKDCRCFVAGCPKAEHVFKRADNFKAHIKRMHPNEDIEAFMKISEEYYHQQQQAERFRRESAVKESASRQLTPLGNTVKQDMIPRGEWNGSAMVNRPHHVNFQGSNVLPTQHGNHHLTASTHSQASPNSLTIPHKAVDLELPQRTVSPSRSNGTKVAFPLSNKQILSPVDRASSSLSMHELPSQRMGLDFPSKLNTAQYTSQDTELDCGPSTASRDAHSNQHNSAEDTESQAQSPRAEVVDDPEFLNRLIRKTLGSNPSPVAQSAAADLMRIMRNGFDSLSGANSPRSSDLVLGEDSAANNTKPKIKCPRCLQLFPRRCDLKKHLKRHSKPYSCTYPKCRKQFGSKADWKRHENTQHFQLECWECPKPSRSKGTQNGHCDKLFYRRETFLAHLKTVHRINDDRTLKTLAKNKKIGRDNHRNFWCGFCNKIVELHEKGLRGVDERFDHLERHFLSPEGKGLEGWINQSENACSNDDEVLLPESECETGSCSGSSEEEGGDSTEGTPLPSSPGATQSRSSKSVAAFDRPRPVSHTSKATKETGLVEKCCNCSIGQYLLAITTTCPNCGHKACDGCGVINVPLEGQKNDTATYLRNR